MRVEELRVADKTVVHTETAPAPFRGAPYSQAIRTGELVFVSGQLALKPGEKELSGGTIEEQTEQVFANPPRSSPRWARARRSSDDGPRTSRLQASRSTPPTSATGPPSTVEGRRAHRARSSRSKQFSPAREWA